MAAKVPPRAREETPAAPPDRAVHDAPPETTKITPAKRKVREARGNLRARGEAFARRRGQS